MSSSPSKPTNLLSLVLPGAMPPSLTSPSSGQVPRIVQGQKFLAGNIPWSWLVAAGRLKGTAVMVGLTIWREYRIRKHLPVQVNLSGLAAELLVDRSSASRGLAALEQAGLVSVDRKPGSTPTVMLCFPPTLPPDKTENCPQDK